MSKKRLYLGRHGNFYEIGMKKRSWNEIDGFVFEDSLLEIEDFVFEEISSIRLKDGEVCKIKSIEKA